MDDEHHSHAPEHYFSTIDEAAEAPNPHDMAMVAVSGEIHQDMFPHTAFIPMMEGSHNQNESYFYPANEAENSTAANFSTYGFHHTPSSGPAGYTADYSWQHAGHHMMFSEAAATADPADPSSSTYGYMPYAQEQQPEVQAETYPSSFDESYVASTSMEQPMSFAYDWNTQGTQTSEHDLASAYSQTGHGSTPMSPIEAGTGARTPSSYTSTSSGGRYSSMYAGTANIDSQVAAAMSGGISVAPSGRVPESASATRKGKGRAKPSHSQRSSAKPGPSAPPSTVFASSSGESNRSGVGPNSSRGSRSSNRGASSPTERGEEKKKRGSHNLVEKQYRNRLNAGFKDLADVLPPESLRARGAGSAVVGEASAAADVAERGPSKAELIDTACQHILQLEQMRDNLAHEVGELQGTQQRLQQTYTNQSYHQGQLFEEQHGLEDNEDDGGEDE